MDYINLISKWWLLVIGAMAGYLAYKYFSSKIGIKEWRKPRENKFFSEINFFLTNKIPYIKLYHNQSVYDVWRTMIFRNMLYIKLRCWKENLLIFIEKNDENIYDSFIQFVNTTLDCYERKRKEDWIPQIVIDKFNEWHKPHIDVLMWWVEAICWWRAFHNRDEMLNAILYVNLSTLVLTITTAEKTLAELNWELSWINYKWKILL